MIPRPRAALAVAAALVAAGCPAPRPAPAPRRPPARLAELRLLPQDTDALILVDLARARTDLPGLRGRLARTLARAAAARLGLDLPDAALVGVERVVVGLTTGPDGSEARALALACGPPGAGPLDAALAVRHGPPGPPYRGRPLAEHGATAWARITARCLAVGTPDRVRLAIDLADHVPGRAAVTEDEALAAPWAALLEPDAGRPPVLAAVLRAPERLQERLARRLGLPAAPALVAARVSAGAWVALRARLLVADRAEATALIRRLESAAGDLGRRAGPRGLLPLLRPLEVHPEGRTVHVQWQVPAADLEARVPALAAALGGSGR